MANVNGTAGNDFIHVPGDGFTPPGGYNEIAQATNHDDDIDAGAGEDIVHGGGGSDTIDGGQNKDKLSGDNDDDFLTGGEGADKLYGGAGADTAEYLHSTAGVRIDLSLEDVIGAGGDASGDQLFSIENLTGSLLRDDILKGDHGKNILNGLGGEDSLVGAGGVDQLFGGSGQDVLNGGADGDYLDGGDDTDTVYYLDSTDGVYVDLRLGEGHFGDAEGDTYKRIENIAGTNEDDALYGDDHVNTIVGFDGNDLLGGGGGADTLNGGDGKDAVIYDLSTLGVVVDLSTDEGTDGDAQGDVYIDIENVRGSNHDDTIIGNKKANEITGFAGRDDLKGNGGADTFIYNRVSDSPTVVGDTIRDFSNGEADRIDLSRIDADPAHHGNQAFFLTGLDHFDGVPGELIIVDDGHIKIIQGNTDGDDSAEFQIVFTTGLPTAAHIDL